MNKGEVGSRRRTPLLAGNWKMYKTSDETSSFVRELASIVGPADGRDIVVAPPFTSLVEAKRSAAGTPIAVAAQNVFWEPEGAYTGEVSALMLVDLGVRYVIIGHSERRQFFGESDAAVGKKVAAALSSALSPIMCVGETESEREAGRTEEVLARQVPAGLVAVRPDQASSLAIAYEPIWAIGTGKTATPEMAQEAISFVRAQVDKALGPEAAGVVRVLYGGSVKPENIDDLMAQPDIDGALVGGASLEVASFARIVQFREL